MKKKKKIDPEQDHRPQELGGEVGGERHTQSANEQTQGGGDRDPKKKLDRDKKKKQEDREKQVVTLEIFPFSP